MKAVAPWRTPRERVIRPNILAMAFNRDKTVDERRGVYELACGHTEVGPLGSRRLHCSSCQKIWDLGLDWDGYRNLGHRDPLLDLDPAHD